MRLIVRASLSSYYPVILPVVPAWCHAKRWSGRLYRSRKAVIGFLLTELKSLSVYPLLRAHVAAIVAVPCLLLCPMLRPLLRPHAAAIAASLAAAIAAVHCCRVCCVPCCGHCCVPLLRPMLRPTPHRFASPTAYSSATSTALRLRSSVSRCHTSRTHLREQT